jgi:hypothetical protein
MEFEVGVVSSRSNICNGGECWNPWKEVIRGVSSPPERKRNRQASPSHLFLIPHC